MGSMVRIPIEPGLSELWDSEDLLARLKLLADRDKALAAFRAFVRADDAYSLAIAERDQENIGTLTENVCKARAAVVPWMGASE